ncbi:hypothetical protein ACQ4LE_004042 [Meloidogyne hapla]
MLLLFLLIFCQNFNDINSGFIKDVWIYFNEQMFILYPDNLKYTLNVLEDQFEVLFTITNIELPNYKKLVEAKIDQITFISQLHLLMSTMKKYNKKILNMG